MCEHLLQLDKDLQKQFKEIFRGQAWSKNCREWAYFDCLLDLKSLRIKYCLPNFIVDHINDDNKAGMELGFICNKCNDGIMGSHPYFEK